MRDPRRLLEGDANELELHGLRAAQAERAPSAGPQRLAAMLGLPAALVALDAATASANTLTSQSVIPAASAGSALLQGATGKLLLVGVLGALGGGAWLLTPPTARPLPTHTEPAAVVQAVSGVRTQPEVAPAPTPALAPEVTPPESAPAHSAAASALAAEVSALDGVRAELHAGRARAALAALDRFEGATPERVLAQEASALRIEALFAAKQAHAARAEAERFLRAHPQSPHVARVQALLRAGRTR